MTRRIRPIGHATKKALGKAPKGFGLIRHPTRRFSLPVGVISRGAAVPGRTPSPILRSLDSCLRRVPRQAAEEPLIPRLAVPFCPGVDFVRTPDDHAVPHGHPALTALVVDQNSGLSYSLLTMAWTVVLKESVIDDLRSPLVWPQGRPALSTPRPRWSPSCSSGRNGETR